MIFDSYTRLQFVGFGWLRSVFSYHPLSSLQLYYNFY